MNLQLHYFRARVQDKLFTHHDKVKENWRHLLTRFSKLCRPYPGETEVKLKEPSQKDDSSSQDVQGLFSCFGEHDADELK